MNATSDMQKGNKSVSMLLREAGADAVNPTCNLCKELFGQCPNGNCNRMYASLACRVDGELRMAQRFVPVGNDGFPIEIGKGYYGGDGRKWVVLGFKPNHRYDIVAMCGDELNTHIKSCWLRSELPVVPNKNGTRIYPGQMLYDPLGTKLYAKSFVKVGDEWAVSCKRFDNGAVETRLARSLSEHRPDSLQILQHDISMGIGNNVEWAARLKTLIPKDQR